MSEKPSALHEGIMRLCAAPTGTAKKRDPYRLIGSTVGIVEVARAFSPGFKIPLIQNGLF